MEKAVYHGTSSVALAAIRAGGGKVAPVFVESYPSLGGTYFTLSRPHAEVHAAQAARAHGGSPVLLLVSPKGERLPDEDWVVAAFDKAPLSDDGERCRNRRLQNFFDDLFVGYESETSLSDHYRKRYEELNREHGITWRDSVRWINTFRQREPLTAGEIVGAQKVEPAGVPPLRLPGLGIQAEAGGPETGLLR